MKKGIIIAHPWEKSFNYAIASRIQEELESNKIDYELIDLYADNFIPSISRKELEQYKNGRALDPLVTKYQNILKDTNELIIIFPIWWYSMPAMLKGFFDKVMLKDFSYIASPKGLIGQLTHIKKTTVITTSDAPTWYIKYIKGNSIKGAFKKGILDDIGLKNMKWINFPNIGTSTKSKREEFLKRLNV